jgi:F-box-like
MPSARPRTCGAAATSSLLLGELQSYSQSTKPPKIESMDNLPTEVLLLLFSYVEPGALLILPRVCSRFRALLTKEAVKKMLNWVNPPILSSQYYLPNTNFFFLPLRI